MIKGYTLYKGLTTQQHKDFFEVLKNFLNEIKPSRVLEIGTAEGGFILAVRNILDDMGLNEVPIKTFDVVNYESHEKLKKQNIEVIIENIFNEKPKFFWGLVPIFSLSLKNKEIKPYIQNDGTTVVFCDGVYKIGEFNCITPLLKKGDFILAHDYVDTWQKYKSNFKNKIWNWCEITEADIEQSVIENNLKFYNQDKFSQAVWVCKVK